MNNKYVSIVLTIIAVVLLFIATEIVKICDSMKCDNKIERIIHFNRWYDVHMFKGTQLNISETSEWNPFDDTNMMNGSHLNLVGGEREKNENQDSQKNTK